MATITASERAHLLHHLRRTASAVCDALKTCSPAQWDFRKPEGGWCAAEIAEHIVVSENNIYHRLQTEVLRSPARAEIPADNADRDERLIRRIPNRDRRVEAPPEMAVSHRFASAAQALQAFQQTRARTIRYVENTGDDLRAHCGEHHTLKTLDGYQWLLLVAAHTERHLAQWAELKAHPQFPEAVRSYYA